MRSNLCVRARAGYGCASGISGRPLASGAAGDDDDDDIPLLNAAAAAASPAKRSRRVAAASAAAAAVRDPSPACAVAPAPPAAFGEPFVGPCQCRAGARFPGLHNLDTEDMGARGLERHFFSEN